MVYTDEDKQKRSKSVVMLDVNEGDFFGEECFQYELNDNIELKSEYTV